jgi:hypothetical protein
VKATITCDVTLVSPVEFEFEGDDVVLALNNNDESVLSFIVKMLQAADSAELRERLTERLRNWDEERGQ